MSPVTYIQSTALNCRYIKVLISILIINVGVLQATELPPIIRYLTSDYHAGNQNWKISQDQNNFLYFANNEGLLEFNGAEWTLYPSPNETIIRSVKVIGNKIYTGSFKEFGYWERSKNGKLIYRSLSDKIKDHISDDEHFWEIIGYEKWILFQSFNKIYLYNVENGTFKFIYPKNGVRRLFLVNNSIYYQSLNEGLFQIKNGISININADKQLNENQIINIYPKGSSLLFQTANNGLFILKDQKLQKYQGRNSEIFNQNDIYSSIMLTDGSIAMGTISNGIYIVSSEFELKFHITQDNGLSNNTALSLLEDKNKNLWVGLDNGINCLNLDSAIKCFVDNSGILGTVYASILHKGILYLGTNQGLFYKTFNSFEKFQLINGTKGQVWSLFEYDGTLFCGHNKGTFIINYKNATNIYSQSGTWKFKKAQGQSDILIQGNYNGLSVLKKVGGNWSFSNQINNFKVSSRYFEITDDLYAYISHEYKGIIRIKLDSFFSSASSPYLYNNPKKGKNAALIKYNNRIIYASKEGFFLLNEKSKTFNIDKSLNTLYEKNSYISGKMTTDKNNRLWIFTTHGIEYFIINNIDPVYKKEIIFLNSDFTKSVSGYENINQLNDSEYLIGTTDGYFIIDTKEMKYSPSKVFINTVSLVNINNKVQDLNFNTDINLDYKSNNVKISFSIPKFNKYIQTEYKYFLKGYSLNWSDWQAEPIAFFRKLPPGKYMFIVKGRSGDESTITEAKLEFKIKKPFYATNIAVLIYIALLLLFAYLVNKAYINYFARQKIKLIAEHNLKMEIQQLENEQKIIKIRNIELTKDISEKNKELAISNLDLIRKNDLLKIIKNDIKKYKDNPNLNKFRSLLADINESIADKDSWEAFKNSFDSIDNDFLKRFHAGHPNLSPSDLKLCAYLRLNLSSKEIAPIINISVRSVEIKRYRLRKKLSLTHDQGLVNYILKY